MKTTYVKRASESELSEIECFVNDLNKQNDNHYTIGKLNGFIVVLDNNNEVLFQIVRCGKCNHIDIITEEYTCYYCGTEFNF